MKDLNTLIGGTGAGGHTDLLTKILYGTNHQLQGVTGLNNTDTQGWSWWTRPRLNLSYDNLVNAPELEFLYSGGEYSMGAAIRAYLDPVSSRFGGEAYTPLVDPFNPFIPMLTNLCLDFTGPPDIVADIYTSDNGKFDEQYFIPKGISGVYNIWESNATFRNVQGDPITALFFTWVTYINRVAEGSMRPWFEQLAEDELDSTTRQYRIITDQSRRRYTKHMCPIAGVPTAATIGSAYEQNSQVPYHEANQTVSVPFMNVGAYYEHRRVIEDFNRVHELFNPAYEELRDESATEFETMVEIDPGAMKRMNFKGYPRLYPNGLIRWFCTKDQWESYLTKYKLKGGDPEEFDIINARLLNNIDTEELDTRVQLYSGLGRAILEEAV